MLFFVGLFLLKLARSLTHSLTHNYMDKCRQKHPKIRKFSFSEEVSSIEWELIDMTDQEQDIINRMHKLVGDKWALIAGRVPGRKAEEIERFWLMRNSDTFKDKRRRK